MIKKHLEGGTLRAVMVSEIKRVIEKYQDDPQAILKSALELGTTPKTLRQWRGPVEKGGWVELQPSIVGSVEKVMAVGKKPAKKAPKKKKAVQPRV
jgi:hypothetical protein